MDGHDKTIADIASWLAEARSAVAFTGAGISTESGIPDFRSPGGVWAKNEPVYYDDFLRSASARHEYWRQKCEAHADFRDARPNVGHLALAKWEAAGQLRGVITQNIDGLHQEAGSGNVLELHGTARRVTCIDCKAMFEVDSLVEQFRQNNAVPPCEACGGRLKHATVSFGQSLSEDVLQEAVAWSQQADLMFAIGSSLVVTPAAELPQVAKAYGGRLVIINRDETPLDAVADAVIRQSIGETPQAIDEAIGMEE